MDQIQKTIDFLDEKLPKYYYVYVLLVILYGSLYITGYLPYLLIYYVFCFFFSPHAGWETSFYLMKRCFRPYKGFPWTFNLTGLGILLSRILVIFPFDTLMYYIDEIFFSGYKKQPITKPIFLLGQPRSGTTKAESILSQDPNILSMKFYEMRFPYLCFQYTIDLIAYVDQTYLNNSIFQLCEKYKIFHLFDETKSERHSMRRLRYNLEDEDDVIFLFHFFLHLELVGSFPDAEVCEYLHDFKGKSVIEKKRMLEFHKMAVQKVLYRRGKNKRYLVKWVFGWNGQLEEAIKMYPDGQFIVFVRNPEDQIPSWFKLLGLLSWDLNGVNPMDHPSLLEAVKKENIKWYNREIDICKNNFGSKNFLMINFEEYYKDIQANTRKIYEYFGTEIVPGSGFDKFLKQQTVEQLSHKRTVTDSKYISRAEIKQKFPNLPAILFDKNFGKTSVSSSSQDDSDDLHQKSE